MNSVVPAQIIKRNGAIVPFDLSRVDRCVKLCYADFEGEEEQPTTPIETIVDSVANMVSAKFSEELPTVEQVQDLVELALIGAGEVEAARRYISYREEHARERVIVPPDVEQAFAVDASFFPTEMQRFMFYDKYSRFNWDLMRRETWVETVDRVVDYLIKLSNGTLGHKTYQRIRKAVLNMEAMPSMRCVAMAGPAAERNSMAIYNCSYLPIDSIDAFAEIMLISLAGCGVGYSVERQYVEEFPRIKRQTGEHLGVHVVGDSSEGWAESVRIGARAWFDGQDIDFDYSEIDMYHPAGTPLRVKGGRASGSGPLKEVHRFIRAMILSQQGTFLRTLDAHDICCVTGGAAVQGGVRRTALIALFDHDDTDMRTCKDGANLDNNPWRANANNSEVWPEDLDQLDLVRQFTHMYEFKRGEPGIFSRYNAWNNVPDRRSKEEFGSNPCGEIILRPWEFCNLTMAVARSDDTIKDLIDKVEVATIIGTIQSLATTFPNMRPEWKQNCEDERLLGVDINGERDCKLLNGPEADGVLSMLKGVALTTNLRIATELGINPSAAITCVKPDGNSSVFLNCSSGMSDRWAPFYIRNARVNTYTPIFKVLKASGVPMDPENGQVAETANTWVVHFPIKAPEGSTFRRDHTAIDQCEFWLLNKLHWTEHNPSVTITYEPHELLPLMQWVWEHKDMIGGMAFLPKDDAQYAQMPYEEITEEEYERLAAEFPPIKWELLYAYEKTDMTEAAQTLACMAGACEVDYGGA